MEQVIDGSKYDFGAMGIRTNNFWAKDLLYITGLIAYNLLICIRRFALNGALRLLAPNRSDHSCYSHQPTRGVPKSQAMGQNQVGYPMRLIFLPNHGGFVVRLSAVDELLTGEMPPDAMNLHPFRLKALPEIRLFYLCLEFLNPCLHSLGTHQRRITKC